MRNVVAVVFNNHDKAFKSLHELWRLHAEGEITVHKASVVVRKSDGEIVAETADGVFDLAIGMALGALLGLLAGPAGAPLGAAGSATLGAATGGAVGLGIDASRADALEQVIDKSDMVLRPSEHAVLADVDEERYAPIDMCMKLVGGRVYRRPKSEITDDTWDELEPHLLSHDYNVAETADRTIL